MKTKLIFLGAILAITPLFANPDTPAPIVPAPAAPVVADPVATKAAPPSFAESRDAFLAFALDKAKTYTGKAEEVATKAVDTAIKEAGPTAIEFLRWRAWYHGLHVVLPLVGALFYFGIWGYWMRRAYKASAFDSWGIPLAMGGGTLGIFICVGVCVSIADHLYPFVQILTAPRIYIIEQVLHLWGK